MALSDDDVRHVARLAQLDLTDDEITALAPQLAEILAYAEKVSEVAAADVPPTSHPYPLRNVFRDDAVVAEPLSPEVVVANAPDAEDLQFRVPKIMGESS
ncbi:Aspartyl-tRNA(Asn) amidotransferase subunit C [Euzebya pacifica]|uniref:Aspartyl/glutamyl-tRNA(Asn/Gln) amidotransferase subunit C n=1 Tax=Euzebya pacifica TaxID=1608957 RepID=A0A346Y1H7_9ACTN|nr:Asp-tRNA(Asn)/Glu-tRNA(Gln) amidotransferase subunit GatC [Euzebya pacifica]AXV08324.1 Aspartyl-tRNA(Asn) amidotransferase subunit C [Euzebya pacifica]